MQSDQADRLELPDMVTRSTAHPDAPHYCVTVDAADGITTGISAIDRALTARLLADPDAAPGDFVRPGHVLPIRTDGRGVLGRRDFGEAAVELCALAGLPPVGLTARAVDDSGELLSGPSAGTIAWAYDVPVVSVEDIVHHRVIHDDGGAAGVTRLDTRKVRVGGALVTAVDFRDDATGAEHTVLLPGAAGKMAAVPTVFVMPECVCRDALLGCGCRQYFDTCFRMAATAGGAVVLPSGSGGDRNTVVPQARVSALMRELGVHAFHVWPTGSDGHCAEPAPCAAAM